MDEMQQMDEKPRKKAVITGITGQDGSYLAEFLLDKGYEVHGMVRRSSVFTTERIDHLYRDKHEKDVRLVLHHGNLLDAGRVRHLLAEVQPDEVYHLAAQSHVRVSFEEPAYTVETIALGTCHLLEGLRDFRDASGKDVRFYNAASSELFGNAPPPQSEDTPFAPRSPYACAKACAFHQTANYREAYGLHASSGILFNHESPRRGETFVTRKITRALGRIKKGLQKKIYLGNLKAQRDWGYAGDYVQAMWMMLQQELPRDYVIATGKTWSVQQFLEVACDHIGVDASRVVEFDSRYLRPTEVNCLQGDAAKAKWAFGWTPTVEFEELVHKMCDSDLELANQEAVLVANGFTNPILRG